MQPCEARRAAKASPVLGSQGGLKQDWAWIICLEESRHTAACMEKSSRIAVSKFILNTLAGGGEGSQQWAAGLEVLLLQAERWSRATFFIWLASEIASGEKLSWKTLLRVCQSKSQATEAKIWKRWTSYKGRLREFPMSMMMETQSAIVRSPIAKLFKGKKDSL